MFFVHKEWDKLFQIKSKHYMNCFAKSILKFEIPLRRGYEVVSLKTHWATAVNAGQWWRLGMGLGPFFKHHYRPALAADAAIDTRCGYTLSQKVKIVEISLLLVCALRNCTSAMDNS